MRSWRKLLTALGVCLALACSGCKFLQDEFTFLDRVPPATPADAPGDVPGTSVAH